MYPYSFIPCPITLLEISSTRLNSNGIFSFFFYFYRNTSNCFTLEYELLVEVNILIMFRKYVGEGTGTPLQYSCLENPMDGGAW